MLEALGAASLAQTQMQGTLGALLVQLKHLNDSAALYGAQNDTCPRALVMIWSRPFPICQFAVYKLCRKMVLAGICRLAFVMQ